MVGLKSKRDTGVSAQPDLKVLAQFHLARLSFLYFLKFCKVKQPAPGKGRIPFELWPHIIEIAEAFLTGKHVVVLKARQIGFSWLVAAYVAWHMRFKENAVVLMLSKGQIEAQDLLSKVRYILINLPEPWRAPLGIDSRSQITVPATGSKVTALPATEDAGVGVDASLVIQDEADRHEFLDENYSTTAPTVGDSGQFIMGSTVKKTRINSLFKKMYNASGKAIDSPSRWVGLFFSWAARPGRDQEWYEETRDAVPEQELEGLSPQLYMEENYPSSVEEALSPSRAVASFNAEVLKVLQSQTRQPVPVPGLPDNCKIYQDYRAGTRYVAGTDVSHGVGRDSSVTVIMDGRTGAVVADLVSKDIDPETLAIESMYLMKHYHRPLWGIEDNDWGIVTIKAAQAERYSRLFSRRTSRGTPKIGWHSDVKSRYELWGELRAGINNGQITIPNAGGLQQFFTCIKNPKNHDRDEAMAGAHDDYPMAVGIAWMMRNTVSLNSDSVLVPASW